MRSCYFCGESNELVLESAHLTPRCIGDKVFDKSNGCVDVDVTVDLCANCHKKLERLQNPYVKLVKTAFKPDEKKEIDLSNVDVFQAVITFVSAKNKKPFVMLDFKGSFGMGSEIRLHHSVIGKALLAWSNADVVDMSVAEGVIVDIVKSKKINSSKNKLIKKPLSLRDRLSIVFDVLSELEKEMGMVNKQQLLDALKKKHGFEYNESSRLIKSMLKEGCLFYAREDCLKRT